MSSYQLIEIRKITGQIEVDTGLHVGGSQETMEISGLDNPVIRNPASGEPFIPGSSLRGKMRSLAEWYFNELPVDGEVTKVQRGTNTAGVFGVPAKKGQDVGPTRLIVRDCQLSEQSRKDFASGTPVTEVKAGNSINRLTAMANPRPMERVLPGVRFDCELVYRIFDFEGDGGKRDRELFDKVLLVSLSLVEADSIGGGGSRGNGKVKLHLNMNGADLDLPALEFTAST